MKILIMCTHGENRSRYLAEYLKRKGYDADYAGVNQSNERELTRKIAGADIVITVHESVRDRLFERFNLTGKRHIELEVEDRPERVLPECKQLSGEDWTAFQEAYVYPELKRQMHGYLPLVF